MRTLKKMPCSSCLGKGYYSYISGVYGKDEFTGYEIGLPIKPRNYPCTKCKGGKGPLFDKAIEDTSIYASYTANPSVTCTKCGRPAKYIHAEFAYGIGDNKIDATNHHKFAKCENCLPKPVSLYFLLGLTWAFTLTSFILAWF